MLAQIKQDALAMPTMARACWCCSQACDMVELPWLFRKAVKVLDVLEASLASCAEC